jgi:hypothetical protein
MPATEQILEKLADALRDADISPMKAEWVVARVHVEIDNLGRTHPDPAPGR